MPTKRYKKLKNKNKTIKHTLKRGGTGRERQGIVDIYKDKLSDATDTAVSSIIDETGAAAMIKNSAEQFNEAFKDPAVREELSQSIEHAGELSSVAIKAAAQPATELIDVASKAIPDALSASLSGAIKVGTDALAAIPGVGAVIELGKIANDTSKAVSAVVEAGSKITEASSDAVIDTTDNYEKLTSETPTDVPRVTPTATPTATPTPTATVVPTPTVTPTIVQKGGAAQFKSLRKLVKQTTNRTLHSIQQFMGSNANKTKRSTKRVRFAV